MIFFFFFFQAEDGIRDGRVTGVQTCALPISQVAGIMVAPDLQKVYAADANDNLIFDIDERTLKYTPIKLQDNDSPDGVARSEERRVGKECRSRWWAYH